jgi:hypothetical protein
MEVYVSPKKFDVFLSYKSEDSDLVERLKNRLLERGVRVWLDKDQIRPGDLFAEALANGIENSRSVGLVVTPNSISSNWVKNEYYRALGLATQGQLQLMPLLFQDSTLPGFLNDRHYIDFRDESHYERRVDQIVWPGITGKHLHIFAMHGDGSFPWECLQREIQKLGHVIDAVDYVESAASDIYRALSEGHRVVAVLDPFEDWPWRNTRFRSPRTYAEAVFEIREKTRGTRGEVVFLLYQHPDAFAQASHDLPEAYITRLQHYFTIPKRFHDSNETATDAEKEELHESFAEVWMKVNRELLRGDVRNSTQFEAES